MITQEAIDDNEPIQIIIKTCNIAKVTSKSFTAVASNDIESVKSMIIEDNDLSYSADQLVLKYNNTVQSDDVELRKI